MTTIELKTAINKLNDNYLVAIDIETTGLNTDKDSIIEIAALKFLNGTCIDKFVSFINPMQKIPEVVIDLTGINDDDVLFSPTISQIESELNNFIGNIPLIGHNLKFDMAVLNREKIGLQNDLIDTYDIAYALVEPGINLTLSSLAEHLNVQFNELHRAEGDALLSFQVFQSLLTYIELIPLQDLSLYSFLSSKVSKQSLTIWELLSKGANVQTFDMESYRNTLNTFTENDYLPQDLSQLQEFIAKFSYQEFISYMFSTNGPISNSIADYYPRQSQLEMSLKTATTFESTSEILIEAGTGTGKTIAYLIPALWFALTNEKKVVISTNTISLQDQLVYKDIPSLLQSLVEQFDDIRINKIAHTQKGKNNYICITKFFDVLNSDTLTTDQYRLYSKVGVWLAKTLTGDRNEIHIPGWQYSNWEKISVGTKHSCSTQGFFCFYDHARKLSNTSTLLIVNHSLLLADLKSGNNILPEYDYLIIDEAHNLEQEIINQFGFEASRNRIIDQLNYYQNSIFLRNRMQNPDKLGDLQNILETHTFNITEFYSQVDIIFKDSVSQNAQNLIINETIVNTKPFISLLPIWTESVQSFKKLLNLNETIPDVQTDEFSDFIFELELQYESIQELLLNRTDDSVYWINKRNRFVSNEDTIFKLAPLNTAEILQSYLYSKGIGVLLTSATLSVNNSLDFASLQYGIQNSQSTLIQSPFNYKKMVLLGLVQDMPDPRNDLFQETLDKTLVNICRSTNGGILVLHTSYNSLRISRNNIKKELEQEGYVVKAQGIDGNLNQLLSSVENHNKFVIMGTNTLWEGIDVPESKLKTLVITRLPFGVPTDPVNIAKSARLSNPFRELSLPQAIIRFRQGFGRLIRNEKGKGSIFVLDSRIVNQQYGKQFLNSVPECFTKTIDTVNVSNLIETWMK